MRRLWCLIRRGVPAGPDYAEPWRAWVRAAAHVGLLAVIAVVFTVVVGLYWLGAQCGLWE